MKNSPPKRPKIKIRYDYSCVVCGPTTTTQHSKSMCCKCYQRSRRPEKFCSTCGTNITNQGKQQFCSDCAKRRSLDRTRACELGISREEYRNSIDSAVIVQNGLCAICSKEAPLHRDHDHETGAFRGMLCGNCNRV